MTDAPAHWPRVMVPFSLHDLECLAEVAYDPVDWRDGEWRITDCGVAVQPKPRFLDEPGALMNATAPEIGAWIDPERTWIDTIKGRPNKTSARLLADAIIGAAADYVRNDAEARRGQAEFDRQAARRE